MTVQVDSQRVTDDIMWYIDMCYINNSISCLEKKTTAKNTCSDMSLHGLSLYSSKLITQEIYTPLCKSCSISRACFYCTKRQHPAQNASTQRHGQPALRDIVRKGFWTIRSFCPEPFLTITSSLFGL